MKSFGTWSLLFSIAFYVSCASEIVVLKASCSEMNWFERGRQDGMQGQPSNNWTITTKSCSDMKAADIQRYMDGWNNGLSMFCTQEHGFLMAKSGQTYKKTCPEKYEEAFLEGYQKGLQVFIIERETSQLIAQIEGMQSELRSDSISEIDKLQLKRSLNVLSEKKQLNLRALEKFNKASFKR